ncbi:hypothetical protein LBMAG42_07840 [Deltaproteobacteria bacterium]|nr:hypothetical protein LBMAG42_07840 [Deltaproteobacteria bacterium]
MPSENQGLRSLIVAFATAGAFAAAASVVAEVGKRRAEEGYIEPPPLLLVVAEAAPWRSGSPPPLWRVLAPKGTPRVVEDERTGLVVAAEVEPEPEAVPTQEAAVGPSNPGDAAPADPVATAAPSAAAPTSLPTRAPAVPTPLIDADHRGMIPFYQALSRGTGLARAAHYGDSTIAADGITGTVRRRLQARFGDGGPGWVDAGLDPRWSARPDLGTKRTGEWETKSILLGGGNGRYGYGGVVSTAPPDGSLTITGAKGAKISSGTLTHFELWYQVGPGHGAFWANLDGASVGGAAADADARADTRLVSDVGEGYSKIAFGASGGPVPFYGVVMETAGPGVVWDALGVVGVGSRSFNYFNKAHLASQVERRRPELIVIQLGGNELGIPVLQRGDGHEYAPYYRAAVDLLRSGAPNAGCLIVTPLDQGTREGGTPMTKPAVKRQVAVQQKVAAEAGCAFWNAFEAMGGEGAIVAWGKRKPPLAWTDLLHLSAAGQDLVGQGLADAIEAGYDDWVATGGPDAAPPTPAEPPRGEVLPIPEPAP